MSKKLVLGATGAAAIVLLVGGSLALADGHRGWGGKGGFGGAGPQMFEQFDSDGDGSINRADIEQARADDWAAHDANGDGVLSLEEFEGVWLNRARQPMVRGFQRLDSDGDAVLTEDEYAAPFERMVERFDEDGDQALSREEIRSGMRGRGHRGRWHRDEDDG